MDDYKVNVLKSQAESLSKLFMTLS